MKPFLPITEGYPAGFSMAVALGDSTGSLGADTGRAVETNMYRLFEADGSTGMFAQAIAGPLREAVISDFNTIHRNQWDIIARQDTMLASLHALANADGPSSGKADERAGRFSELDELQTQEEIAVAARRWKLGQIGVVVEQ